MLIGFLLNLFFFVFYLKALASFGIQLLLFATSIHIAFLESLLRAMEGLEAILFLPFSVAIFCTTKLPRKIYWPILFYIMWGFLGFWPVFPFAADLPLRDFLGALLALILAIHNLKMRRALTGTAWGTFEESYFTQGLGFSFVRFFLGLPLFFLAAALLIFVGFIGVGIKSLETEARGHLRIDLAGLHTRHSVYEKGERKVHLIGMSHIGEDKFYKNVLASIPESDSLVLAEGVSDRHKILKEGMSYSKLAKTFGLASQSESFNSLLNKSHKVVYADIDVSDLSKETIELLKVLANLFNGKIDQQSLGKLSRSNDMLVLKNEIIVKRNERLMQEFDKFSPRFKTIIIPWGALHLADIEERILQRGYRAYSSEEAISIAFF